MPGTLFIISAPSGAGKTCLVKALLSAVPNLSLSVSYTTRPPRPLEVDGQDYHFVSLDTFEKMEAEGEFLETAHIYGNWYGTAKSDIERRLKETDVVLEIDWQGAQQILNMGLESVVTIFVLPPSMEELEKRLRLRGQDNEETIQYRLKGAKSEIAHVPEYQFVIINREFETAITDLMSIVRTSYLHQGRQADFWRKLYDSIN